MKSVSLIAILALLVACTTVPVQRLYQPGRSDSDIAKAILMDSINIPTVIGRGRVPELADYYSRILKDAGFSEDDIVITEYGETATLSATLRGRASGKPILLIGHMDVVDADPSDWERDPFDAVEDAGYIFGRGAFDNKFDVAMMVTTLANLKRDAFSPARDVVLLLTGDEETSQATTRALAKHYQGAQLLLNGDAGGGFLGDDDNAQYYLLQAAEKSYADFQIEFTSPGGHSSRPFRPNAITQLANALAKLGAYDFAPQLNELTEASLRGVAQQVDADLGAAMMRFVANPGDSEAIQTIRKNPEYVGQIGTTCVATTVDAGHAKNALPQRATANINCRIYPGVSVDAVKAELESIIDDPAARITTTYEPTVTTASPLRDDVIAAVTDAVHAGHPGLPIIPNMSAFTTDSVPFRALGIPSYGISGLFIRPSDDYRHGMNERVPVAAIPQALDHWESIIRSLTSE